VEPGKENSDDESYYYDDHLGENRDPEPWEGEEKEEKEGQGQRRKRDVDQSKAKNQKRTAFTQTESVPSSDLISLYATGYSLDTVGYSIFISKYTVHYESIQKAWEFDFFSGPALVYPSIEVFTFSGYFCFSPNRKNLHFNHFNFI